MTAEYEQKYFEYIELIRRRLTPERFEHSMLVAKSAVELAKRYGADEQKAYAAGILHDVMKNAGDKESLSLFREAGITLLPYELHNKKLWHSKAGALYVEKTLGITDADIINAVRYHTTGRAGMSLLEKVIFIADYISDERDYNGVEEMRRLSVESLEAAMLFALKFSLGSLSAKGRTISPASLDCYNELIITNEGE